MPYTLPTATDFKTRFPEFGVVTDALIDLIIAEETSNFVDETWPEADYQPAIRFLTAHILTKEGEPARTESGGGSGPASSAPVKRAKVGDVETEFAVEASSSGSGSTGSDQDFSSTYYGQQFLIIRNRNFQAVAVT